MKDPVIELLAYKEAIKLWTDMLPVAKQKIAMQRKLEGLSEEQNSQGVRVFERALEIYEAAIEQATVYLQKLGDAPSN